MEALEFLSLVLSIASVTSGALILAMAAPEATPGDRPRLLS
jgi:hypothetical protein